MRKGTTILEALIATVTLTVLVTSIFPIVGWLVTRSKEKQYDSEASTVLTSGIEVAYNVFLDDWEGFSVGTAGSPVVYHPALDVSDGVWTLANGEQLVETRFTRRLEVVELCRKNDTGERVSDCSSGSSVDPDSRIITGVVSWSEGGLPKEIEAELMLTKL